MNTEQGGESGSDRTQGVNAPDDSNKTGNAARKPDPADSASGRADYEPVFFTDAQRARILEAVAETERSTGAEIVPVVVLTSSSYPAGYVRGLSAWVAAGSLVGLGGSLALASPWYVFLGAIVAGVLFWGLSIHSPSIRYRFLKAGEKTTATLTAAQAMYYRQGLCRTIDSTGVLVYLSLMEKRAWVLADKGILARYPADRWNDIAVRMNKMIEIGDSYRALLEGLECIGRLLDGEIPRRDDDINELPDLICLYTGEAGTAP